VPEPLTPIASLAGSMFAYRASEDGKGMVPVERRKACECGREFTQSLMAPSELASLERMGHIATFMRQIPECWVPVHCPPCERVQLGHQSRIDEARNAPRVASTVPDRRDIA
jgi:hypothetical protein